MLALLPSPDDSVVDLSLHGRGAVSWEICLNKLLIFRAR